MAITNPLSEEQHLIVCLMEEAGEVVQAASKCLRFGMHDSPPDSKLELNRSYLLREIIDFLGVLEEVLERGILVPSGEAETFEMIAAKREKIKKFMVYARSKGALE